MIQSPPLHNLKDLKNKSRAISSFSDFLAEMMLESDVPEEHKICVRICVQAKRICKATEAITERFSDTKQDPVACFEVRKEVLEYLSLVEAGLRQFMETTKLPNETN